jgi:hypothetical protein
MRASAPDMHQMAGRGHKEALTEFVNARILEAMQLEQTDVLLDIGCGDGRLLRNASRVSQRIGIVPTKEEKDRLEAILPDSVFYTGLAQKLPVSSHTAGKIVCNSVLLLMKSESDVADALREIARVARKDAKIWIGEIPDTDEYAEYKMYCGSSVPGMLWHLLKNHGVRTFMGMCRRLMKAQFGNEELIINSAQLYHSPPDKFVALAQSCGLRLETHFRHLEVDAQGRAVESKYRFDYVFRK